MEAALRALSDVEPLLRALGVLLLAFVFAAARAGKTGGAAAPGPRAFLARFGAALAVQTSLVAALNYAVNPFGMYSTHIVEPIVPHSRAEKMRLYAAFQPPPEIVVLGNSESFTMPPGYIRERTGRPAFNASIHGGVPGDYLAFFRYMLALHKVPQVLIVPVSVEVLRPNLPTGFEPHDPLSSFRTGEAGGRLGVAGELIGLRQTEASLRLLAVEGKGRGTPQYRFDADGFGHFLDTRPLDEAVDAYLAKDWAPSLFDFEDLDSAQISHLEELLSLCKEHGVRVVVYVPPYHPRAAAVYERTSRLPELKAQMLSRLHQWQRQSLILAVHDFSHVESFAGSAAMFHDLAHPTAEASRRMLAVMLPRLAPDS